MAGSCDNSIFNILRNCWSVFFFSVMEIAPFYILWNSMEGFQFIYILINTNNIFKGWIRWKHPPAEIFSTHIQVWRATGAGVIWVSHRCSRFVVSPLLFLSHSKLLDLALHFHTPTLSGSLHLLCSLVMGSFPKISTYLSFISEIIPLLKP